jgi:hypothetical protein
MIPHVIHDARIYGVRRAGLQTLVQNRSLIVDRRSNVGRRSVATNHRFVCIRISAVMLFTDWHFGRVSASISPVSAC